MPVHLFKSRIYKAEALQIEYPPAKFSQMPHSTSVAQEISLFRARIHERWLDFFFFFLHNSHIHVQYIPLSLIWMKYNAGISWIMVFIRGDDVTIRVLESILVSKDVQSSIEVRSALRQFMRDESLLIFAEIAEESVEIKLVCTEFLIRVFAMIGDVEVFDLIVFRLLK